MAMVRLWRGRRGDLPLTGADYHQGSPHTLLGRDGGWEEVDRTGRVAVVWGQRDRGVPVCVYVGVLLSGVERRRRRSLLLICVRLY